MTFGQLTRWEFSDVYHPQKCGLMNKWSNQTMDLLAAMVTSPDLGYLIYPAKLGGKRVKLYFLGPVNWFQQHLTRGPVARDPVEGNLTMSPPRTRNPEPMASFGIA